jgi:putative component of membrane protein insertase Oxa1/YidC/SpoIIIJ protein YidD
MISSSGAIRTGVSRMMQVAECTGNQSSGLDILADDDHENEKEKDNFSTSVSRFK